MRGRGYAVEFSSAAERSRWELAHGGAPAAGDARGVELRDVRDVNALIRETVEAEVAESERRAEEYYEAYIATGGDPDEFIRTSDIAFDIAYAVDQKFGISEAIGKVFSKAAEVIGRFF